MRFLRVVLLVCAVVGLGSQRLLAVVIEDFEGYATGDIDTVGSGVWTAEVDSMGNVVSEGGNQYLTYGDNGGGDWRFLFRDAGVALADEGEFSFRLYVENESADHAIGLVGEAEGDIDWYADFGPYVRVSDDSAGLPGVASLDVRDGGGFVDDIATLNVGQWYDVRFVINTSGGDAGNGGSNIFVDEVLAFSNADFRHAYGAPLDTLLLMGGNGFGQNVRVDDFNMEVFNLADGDVDGDGDADQLDYDIILGNLQTEVSSRGEGDLNGDGIVNLADFAEWRLARQAFLSAAASEVPEPNSIALFLVAGGGCLLCRRKGQCFLVCMASFVVLTSTAMAQLGNPIPTPIVKQGLRVQLEDVVQFPDSESSLGGKPDHRPQSRARLNFFREAPDGRKFVNDLRGQLYVLDENDQPDLYVDLDADNGGAGSIFPASWYGGGLAAGFISYTFHPEFATNGQFYTLHMERAANTSAVPDFQTTDLGNPSQGVTWHTIITEWTSALPAAPTWNEATGSRREVLRVGTTASAYFHPYGDLQFNPNSDPGDDDYGLLYVSGGDWGYINGAGAPQDPNTEGQPGQLQRLDSLASSLIRIDPRSPTVSGGQAGLGDYTIPSDNPFVDGDPNTLDEIYAFGFRNGHRMAWDDDGTLFVNSVGHAQIEEVERIVAGGNYGWGFREGTFINGNDLANGGNGDADVVFAHNVSDAQDVDFRGEEYLYPVAQYDHGEGSANAGGFVYRGSQIPELYGKYVFGDIVNGRIFATDVAEMKNVDIFEPGPTAAIEEIQLFRKDQFGVETNVDLRGGVLPGRVDLRFGLDADGEIWIITKEDGYLRRLVGTGPTLVLYVDPTTGQSVLMNEASEPIDITVYSILSETNSLVSGNWESLFDQGVPGWDEAPAATSALSEANPFDSLLLQPGDRFNLGEIFDTVEGDEDLVLEYLVAEAADFANGAVRYRLAADFNFDHVVDQLDLQQWQDAYGVDGTADADGDGDSDSRDFLIWQRQNGLTTAELAAASAVPEPGCLLLLALSVLMVSCRYAETPTRRSCSVENS